METKRSKRKKNRRERAKETPEVEMSSEILPSTTITTARLP